jgi:hypothetical protein
MKSFQVVLEKIFMNNFHGFWDSVADDTVYTAHCPKTHEKFPGSFANAEVISSDRRTLFINIFFQHHLETFHKFEGYIKEIM